MRMQRFWLGALVTALSVGGALVAGFAIDRSGGVASSAGGGMTAGAFTNTSGR